jgi:hypothetical protein
MKSLWIAVVTFMFTLSALAVSPKPMQCKGIYQYSDSLQTVYLTAIVLSNDHLANVSVTEVLSLRVAGARPSVSNFKVRTVAADTNYRPRVPAYKSMNRFALSYSGWETINLLLPPVLPIAGNIRGVYQTVGHEGKPPVALTCRIGQ